MCWLLCWWLDVGVGDGDGDGVVIGWNDVCGGCSQYTHTTNSNKDSNRIKSACHQQVIRNNFQYFNYIQFKCQFMKTTNERQDRTSLDY